MNYELAKKLKDAGFPQKSERWYHNGEIETLRMLDEWAENHLGVYENAVSIPTLSELIEACKGDKPNSFYLDFNDEWAVYEEPNKEGMWKARYYADTPVGFYETRGSTPEVAVARLYLSLKRDTISGNAKGDIHTNGNHEENTE